jgi:hypothetical protein
LTKLRIGAPGRKSRLIMRRPCSCSARLSAWPPASATGIWAGSAPPWLANSSPCATLAMLQATMIWLASLTIWPLPAGPT